MTYVVIGIMVVAFLLSIYRLRPGGPGPGVNWVPRRFRRTMNSAYEAQGWQTPYDAEGNRSKDRPPV